ncbi:MAG: hypothetical protein HYY04_02705 [Chloroflexi bacterium]|nr:hypothetical protein [Chloroflexota bacterium]
MKILGERTTFQPDHSSTSYLFYSPQRLDEHARRLAGSFSRRARVETHTAAYTYNVEGYDLPAGAEDQLFAGPFEVMVSESYDWWTFAFTVPHSAEALKWLEPFDEVTGPDDTGIRVEPLKSGGKIKVTIYCRLESSGDWMEPDKDPFEPFVPRLLDLRDEIARGDPSGLRLIAARFDPTRWKPPRQASEVARWLARNIEVDANGDEDGDAEDGDGDGGR